MRERNTITKTHNAAEHALLGSPLHMGASSFDDFHGVKIIFSTNFLLLYDVGDWEQK